MNPLSHYSWLQMVNCPWVIYNNKGFQLMFHIIKHGTTLCAVILLNEQMFTVNFNITPQKLKKEVN